MFFFLQISLNTGKYQNQYPFIVWLVNLDKENMAAVHSKFQILGYVVPKNYYWPFLNHFICITKVSNQCLDILVYTYTTLR